MQHGQPRMEQAMNTLRWMRTCGLSALAMTTALGAGAAMAYTVPLSTPLGITLVDVSGPPGSATPLLLWRRLGDANGKPLYTYDADQAGKSSCYGDCAKEFPPFVADAHAKASGDFSLIQRDDHLKQWAYQGKALYRYSGKDPVGEPKIGGVNGALNAQDSAKVLDPANNLY